MKRAYLYLLASLLALSSTPVNAQEFTGEIGLEGRGFPRGALYEGQHESSVSVYAMPEFYADWENGYQSITITPFFRLDSGDAARTHFDLREFYWLKAANDWELKVGLSKVFWGVTESQHLVDIINQTDAVEGPDGEQKLGQPMVQFTWIPTWGVIDFFALPWFRERTFPGSDGRLRFPLIVDEDEARFNRRLDLAVRWYHSINIFDIGLSHFWGTSREPRLSLGISNEQVPFLIPNYESINQTGLDIQATVGGWLWKGEAITRSGQGDRFYAFTGGFEYTFGNIGNTGADLGVLAEYHYDSRDAIDFEGLQVGLASADPEFLASLADQRLAVSLFDNDTFAGARVALNDVQSTEFLGGVVVDNNTGTTSLFLESSRRLGDRWTVDLEVRSFMNTDPADALYSFRRDSYGQLLLSYYF